MKIINRVTALLLAAVMTLSLCSCGQSEAKVSEPFNYSGYNTEEYSGYRKKSEYVEMSDGTKLAVDIYLPGGKCIR